MNSTTTDRASRHPYRPVLHALAVLTAILTFPLLLSGGTVTVYRVGMAVPDWPTTFGVNMVLYDMLNSPWGVQLEHSHRLLGMLVGIACIVVLVGYLAFERRGWLKAMALGVLLAVSLQGVLGGTRVLENSQLLAGIHGCTAQAFFALVVALAVLSGRDWAAPGGPAGIPALGLQTVLAWGFVVLQVVLWGQVERALPWMGVLAYAVVLLLAFSYAVLLLVQWLDRAWSAGGPAGVVRVLEDPSHLRRKALVTLLLVFMQIVLGAWVRHASTTAALAVHALWATTVWGHVVVLALRVLKRRRDWLALAPSAWAMLGLATFQVVLGIAAWWLLRPFDGVSRSVWPAQAVVRVVHQGAGALLLAAALVLTLRAYRHLKAPERTREPGPVPVSLEAVS